MRREASVRVWVRYWRARRAAGLCVLIMAVGMLGAICTNVEIQRDVDNPYNCVAVGGTCVWVAEGDPPGGTYAWEGLVEPNDANAVTFQAPSDPNLAGDYTVTVTYNYDDGDPNHQFLQSNNWLTMKVMAVTELIPEPSKLWYPDAPNVWVAPIQLPFTHAYDVFARYTPNDVPDYSLPDGIIEWTGGIVTPSQLNRWVPADIAGTTELTATCGTSSATTTFKVCEVASLTVTGAVLEPNTFPAWYIAPAADEGYVTAAANLNPTVTNEAALKVLTWSPWWELVGDPNDWVNMKLPLNEPGTQYVYARCGVSSIACYISIIRVNSITLEDDSIGQSRTYPGDANYIFARQHPYGGATVMLFGDVEPDESILDTYVLWEVEGESAEPNSHFLDSMNPQLITLTPSQGNREFTVRVGIDADLDEQLDAGEVVHEMSVYVVNADLGIDSDNDDDIDAADDLIEFGAPGKYVSLNGDPNDPNTHDPNNLVEIRLKGIGGSDNAKWMLGWWPPPGSEPYLTPTIAVWEDPNRTQAVDADPNHWGDPNYWVSASQMPETLYVEGINPNLSEGGTYLRLFFDPEGDGQWIYVDDVRLTVQE